MKAIDDQVNGPNEKKQEQYLSAKAKAMHALHALAIPFDRLCNTVDTW